MKTYVRMSIVLIFAFVFAAHASAQPIVLGIHGADVHYTVTLTKQFAVPPPKLELPKRFSLQRLNLHSGFNEVHVREDGTAQQFVIAPPSSFNDTNPAALRLGESEPHQSHSKMKMVAIVVGAAIAIAAGVSVVHHK